MSGGPQVAFWKAVRQLSGPPLCLPREVAITEMAKVLSDREWRRFAERYPRNGVPR